MASKLVADTIAAHTVTIFSKSACPYCTKAKRAFASIGCTPFVMELDGRQDGDEIQRVLGGITGGTTVPRVFIAGEFIGGGDDTAAAAASGALLEKCKAAGVPLK
jgi:glutaredoxin 3